MKIERVQANRAPMLLFHGHVGMGKTSLAMQLERPLAILTERGLPFGISVDALSDIDTYEGILGGLRAFYKEPGEYRSLVIDTADALEPMIFEHVCAEHRWKSIEAGAYGKGYVFAEGRWRQLLAALSAIRDKHGITIAMTCHTDVVRVDDPRAPSFTSYQPKLHKRAGR
jgi:AAA domain